MTYLIYFCELCTSTVCPPPLSQHIYLSSPPPSPPSPPPLKVKGDCPFKQIIENNARHVEDVWWRGGRGGERRPTCKTPPTLMT